MPNSAQSCLLRPHAAITQAAVAAAVAAGKGEEPLRGGAPHIVPQPLVSKLNNKLTRSWTGTPGQATGTYADAILAAAGTDTVEADASGEKHKAGEASAMGNDEATARNSNEPITGTPPEAAKNPEAVKHGAGACAAHEEIRASVKDRLAVAVESGDGAGVQSETEANQESCRADSPAAKRRKRDTGSEEDDEQGSNNVHMVQCSRCKCEVPRNNAQVDSRAKNNPTFKCNPCNTRMAMLYRQFGSWPSNEFKSWTAEEQTAFYEEIKEFKGKQLQKVVQEKFPKKRKHYRDQFTEYSYLPIGYFEKMGYDTKAIEENCTDTRDHPYLGTTYRVDVCKGREGQINETVRESDVGMKGEKSVESAKPRPNPKSEEEKQRDKNLSEAEKARERISGTFETLDGFLVRDKKVDCEQVGQWAFDAYTELAQVKAAAEITIQSGGMTEFQFNTKDVTERLIEAKTAKSVVEGFIRDHFEAKEESSLDVE